MTVSRFSLCAALLTNAVLLFSCPSALLLADDTSSAAKDSSPKRKAAQAKKAESADVPPLFVTHEGVTYNFTREKFGTWNAAAVKDGKTLWEKNILPHEHTKPGDAPDEITQVEMGNGFNAIPKSGWYVAYEAYAVIGGVSLDKGETVRFMGHGFGIPDPAVPHALTRNPPAGAPQVFTVEHNNRTHTARSDADMLGPWRVTCTDAAKKVIWERKLPRGIWISGMKTKDVERIMNAEPFEMKTFTLLDIEGCRHLMVLTDTGDVVGHESYKK